MIELRQAQSCWWYSCTYLKLVQWAECDHCGCPESIIGRSQPFILEQLPG